MAFSSSTSSHSRSVMLRELQRASKEELIDHYRRFIPRGDIVKVLTYERVKDHLESILRNNSSESRLLDDIASYICPRDAICPHCQDTLCTGSRIIFATLLLIGQEERIELFHAHTDPRICDKDLSFLDRNPEPEISHMPEAFHSLSDIDKELFRHYQWQMRSPYIKRLGRDEKYIVLDPQVSLPWTDYDITTPEWGQMSKVGRIQIENDHHDLGRHDNFALKVFEARLRSSGKLDDRYFRKEIEANQRTPIHDRIVPLLAAFKHRERFYLILPWADGGNLQELWKNHSPIDSEATPWYSAQWLVAECLGIADSLATTHSPPEDSDPSNTVGSVSQLHTDIKPENILCFKTGSESEETFTLKLADFGLAMKVERSTGLKSDDVVHTKSYRPPEHDVEEYVSLKFDIWCLGCLYLDFITWAVQGWGGIGSFQDARMGEGHGREFTEAMGRIDEDTFFKKTAEYPPRYSSINFKSIREIKEMDDLERPENVNSRMPILLKQYLLGFQRSGIQTECKVKDKVIKHITELQNHTRCDPALKEFLSFIIAKMLVIKPGGRANSDEVRQFLDGLKTKIENN